MRNNPAKVFQGEPCRHGHSGIRYTTGKACVECQRIRDVAARERRKAGNPQSAPGQPS